MDPLKHTGTEEVKQTLDAPDDNAEMTLGERIKSRREELGIRVIDLATHVGVSVQAIYQWEDGTIQELTATSAVRAADFLKTSTRWLVTGIGPRVRPPSFSLDAEQTELLENFRYLGHDGKSAVLAICRQLAIQAKAQTPDK